MSNFDDYGNGQNPYGNGQNPYGNGQNPYGGGQDPYGANGSGAGNPYDVSARSMLQNSMNNNNGEFGGASGYNNVNGYNNSNGYTNGYANGTNGSNDPYSVFGNLDSQYSGMQGAMNSTSPVGDAMAGIASVLNVNELLSRSFIYMFIALLITGITSLCVASSPSLVYTILGAGRFGFLIIFGAEIGLLFACNSAIKNNNLVLSAILFALFAIVNGLTFSVIFLAFELTSIVTVFFMTAVVFAVLSVVGATTKKDLTSWGPFLFAGLIGILIGSIVNIFLGNSFADFVVTIIGVVVFVLYTVYDVNKIVKISKTKTGISTEVLAFYGAIELYLDFINLFLKLLRLLGKKK